MTNYINSVIAATRRRFARSMHNPSSAVLLLVIMTVASGGPASAAADETEARTFFTKFVAAQNAHNADDVKAMLWNSPSMLWFSRGVETRGRDAVADRFREYYEGTWHLEPDMSQFRPSVITDDVMQILVPVVFTRGLPGKPPQDNTFLISQTFVRDANGWHVASILPIANTQLKQSAGGAFMRGPMVGITDEELFDIAEAVHQTSGGTELYRLFDVRTQEDLVCHLVARSVPTTLQHLRARAGATTPRILLAEAIEKGFLLTNQG